MAEIVSETLTTSQDTADEIGLHPRMKLFADEWLTGANTGKPFNGPAAYEFAGYTVNDQQPSVNPSKLLRHPKVAEYIRRRMEEHSMTVDEVFMRYTQIARSSVGEALDMDPATGRLRLNAAALLDEMRHMVKGFAYDSNGNPKVEFHDPMAALNQIARILGMTKDGLEISGPGGAPVTMQVQFVAPTGQEIELGTTNQLKKGEDFSEYDED